MESWIRGAVLTLRQVGLWLGLAVGLATSLPKILVAQEAPQKHPAPEAAALKEAETALRQTFKSDFSKKAKRPAGLGEEADWPGGRRRRCGSPRQAIRDADSGPRPGS